MPGHVPRRGRLLLGLPTLGRIPRSAAVLLAALLAATAVGVPVPAEVRAQGLVESPHIRVDPTCAPVPADDVGAQITITVRGYSFQAGQTVAIRWAGQPAAAPADAIPVGPFGTFESTFVVPIGGGPFTYPVEAIYLGTTNFIAASTSFSVPCPDPRPSITISPDCGAPGAAVGVHVDGTGFVPNLPIQARIVDPRDPQIVYAQLSPAALDPNAVSLDLPQFTPPGVGTYRVIVDQVVTGEVFDMTPFTATAYFFAPCAQLTVTPTCGPEGGPPNRYALVLSGTGFQPNFGLEFMFDPLGADQRFYWDFSVGPDSNWGPVEINPYQRGAGVYEVAVRQLGGEAGESVARAAFGVPCPPPAVSIDPTCAPPQLVGDTPRSFALSVVGTGFQPNTPATVTFDPDGLSGPGYIAESTDVVASPEGTVAAALIVAARPANTYRVLVRQTGTSVPDVFVAFNVPCRTPAAAINVRPTCGVEAPGQPEAYSFAIVGRRFIPGLVEIIFDPDGSPETFTAIADDPQGRFEQTITPSGRPAGSYRIIAQQRDANQTLSQATFDRFRVPCRTDPDDPDLPTLLIRPGSANPGFVVQVEGSGFPAESNVSLFWSRGIDAGRPIEVEVGADGSFTRQILLFAHDFTGARELTAGTAADPGAFDEARATLLVTPGQGSPPAYSIFNAGPGEPGPIIIRR